MRKKIGRLFLLIGLLVSLNMTAYAETSYGNSDWSVVFTKDKKMETNFKTSDIDDVIYGLQPGDIDNHHVTDLLPADEDSQAPETEGRV